MNKVEHEVTTKDDKLYEEQFWVHTGDHSIKILTREEMETAAFYVKNNPDKFKINQ